MRQKNFNFYEETLRVPLVYSNPKLFKRRGRQRRARLPRRLPADAGEPGRRAPPRATTGRASTTPSTILKRTAKPPQDYIVFTYDDYQSGQAAVPTPRRRNHIVSIRETRWKLAEYYDITTTVDTSTGAITEKPGPKPPQWEMYDLKTDPYEEMKKSTSHFKGYERTAVQEREFLRLKKKLAKVEKTRLRPLAKSA